MMAATERLNAHPGELQVWAVSSRPPAGSDPGQWAAWLLQLGIRAGQLPDTGGYYAHLLLRHGAAIWEAGPRGVRGGLAAEYLQPHLCTHVYRVAAREADESQIIAWLCGHVGDGYDYPQFARMACRRLGIENQVTRLIALLDSESLGVCSTLVAFAYLLVGLDLPHLVGAPLWDFAPDHIVHLHRLYPARVLLRGTLEIP